MFIGQEFSFDAELREDLAPAAAGSLDGIHHCDARRLAIPLA
jgi:hypothetical protein